ncbi:TetR/AcrR family transcriptional regulator [Angustibacter sp. McL0619]|uniref:TetR/AcrR family transcriptional regulator n=1 Tax=Angustibacter sp. McL0619 TaxID=3415676 RepID=UPI003CF0A3E7
MASTAAGDPALADAFVDLPDTPRRIVQAAVAAFADRGYHATTTRDIAIGAGLSPAGLYVHYPSKAAVLAQVSLLGHQGALDLVREALSPQTPGSSTQRLRRCVETFTAWHARHHTVARVVQYELGALPAADRVEVAQMRRAIESLVEAEVRRGAAAGELSLDDPHGVTRAILSLSIDVCRWYDPAGRESPEDVATLYGRLALRMLGAAQAPTTTSPEVT